MGTRNNWQERFRQAMLEKREALQRALRSNLKSFRNDLESQVRVADAVEKAADDAADSVMAGLVAIESGQLAQIEEALRRLEDGTYGQCLDCGKSIPQARLQMVPFALRCVDCQQGQDGRRAFRG